MLSENVLLVYLGFNNFQNYRTFIKSNTGKLAALLELMWQIRNLLLKSCENLFSCNLCHFLILFRVE